LKIEQEVDHLEFRQEPEMSLRDLLTIAQKRRMYILGTMVLAVVLTALYCIVCTRRYESSGTVQIGKEDSSGLGLQDLLDQGAGSSSSPLETDTIVGTQASILKSDTLAIRTVENLHIEKTLASQGHRNPLGWVIGLISPKGVPDKPGTGLDDSPQRLRRVLAIFSKNLTVKPVSGTRLIEIDFLNPDPKLAAAVVNELMQGLTDYNFQTRYNATNQASQWLTGQLAELRKQSEALQQKVVDLERQSGVYSFGTVDAQGREMSYSGVLDKLQQDTAALSAAQQSLFLRGAIAKAAEGGDADMLSGLAGTASGSTSSGMSNSLDLIQHLREQRSSQEAAIQEAETKFGPTYPKLVQLRASLAGIDHSIQDEIERIRARAENDYSIAQKAEAKVREEYDRQKKVADQLNDKAVEYTIVRQEATESRELYEDMLKRLKEAGVIEGLKSSNISVVDPGRVPALPVKPNVLLYMGASVTGGLFLGCLAALFIDTIDNKIGGTHEVETLTGQTLLGATPMMQDLIPQRVQDRLPASAQLKTLQDPQSTFAEAVRSIRTAILLTGSGQCCRSILVTSSIPSEGKTIISSNLAVVLAQSNRKVLLVDADMRRGRLSRLWRLPRSFGLSELLAGQTEEPTLRKHPEIPTLDILLSGTPPPNPADLLDSNFAAWLTRWRESYDFIVIDGTPMLPVTDAHILHPMMDITLLIARSGLTERVQLQRSFRALKSVSDHFVGTILNGLRPQDESYYGYYGYRKYGYVYSEDGNGETS
jgi:capsular exopolysaccharide synthesis family protein